jgi:hypothetical protein
MMTRQLLERVRDQLKQCNAISYEREFCEQWLGKSECYMRTLKYGGLAPSADAMMTCASKLQWYAAQLNKSTAVHHAHWAEVFEGLRVDCVLAVEAEAQRKWRAHMNGSTAE